MGWLKNVDITLMNLGEIDSKLPNVLLDSWSDIFRCGFGNCQHLDEYSDQWILKHRVNRSIEFQAELNSLKL